VSASKLVVPYSAHVTRLAPLRGRCMNAGAHAADRQLRQARASARAQLRRACTLNVLTYPVAVRSYTYNLYHLIAAVNEGAERVPLPAVLPKAQNRDSTSARGSAEPPVVIYNDEVSWEELARVLDDGCFDSGAWLGVREVACVALRHPDASPSVAVVISPGPGTPERADDIGVRTRVAPAKRAADASPHQASACRCCAPAPRCPSSASAWATKRSARRMAHVLCGRSSRCTAG